MKTRLAAFIPLFLALFVPASCTFAQPSPIAGDWQGALSIQGFQLRIVFHIKSGVFGGFQATMDSPDQGAAGIGVDSVLYADGHLRIVMLRLQGLYVGTMEPGDSTLKGTWTQRGVSFPLDLRRMQSPIVVSRPQEPKPPYPYREEEVSFENHDAGITLAGTLTEPRSGGPFPAAVMITGSGPQDRDETIFNHKPFKVIADYLTRRGIAVLRYDDRGTAKSTGNFATATSLDFASDARAAIKFLESRTEIDPKHIGLIGHSEGGLIAPMVASTSRDVAFIVLLAGPSLPGTEIIILQDSLIAIANGAKPENLRDERMKKESLFKVIASENDTSVMRKKLREVMLSIAGQSKDTTSQADRETAIERTIGQLTSPWFRFFLFYDPVPALEKVKCPVLALNGEKDLQVPPDADLAGIARALQKGGNRNATVKKLKDLNHLFQHATTGSPMEYPKIEETFAPEALSVMADWIRQTVGMK